MTLRQQRNRVLLGWVIASGLCCAHSENFVWVQDYPAQPPLPSACRVDFSDQLVVTVWNQPQLSGPHRVRSDGMITLPLIGDLAVAGLTTEDAAAQVVSALDGLVLEPKVTVELLDRPPPQVTVAGEVRAPGRFELRARDGVLELLALSGGLTEFADRDGIFVLRRESPITRIRFDHQQLLRGDPDAVGFRLRDGDVIVVE